MWLIVYAIIAVTVAVAVFVAAEWFREFGAAAADHPGVLAAIGGLIWPVLLVGLAEWGVLVLAGSWLRPA